MLTNKESEHLEDMLQVDLEIMSTNRAKILNTQSLLKKISTTGSPRKQCSMKSSILGFTLDGGSIESIS